MLFPTGPDSWLMSGLLSDLTASVGAATEMKDNEHANSIVAGARRTMVWIIPEIYWNPTTGQECTGNWQ